MPFSSASANRSRAICAVGANVLSTYTRLPLRSGFWQSAQCCSGLSGESTMMQSLFSISASMLSQRSTCIASHHCAVVFPPSGESISPYAYATVYAPPDAFSIHAG